MEHWSGEDKDYSVKLRIQNLKIFRKDHFFLFRGNLPNHDFIETQDYISNQII